MDPLLMPWIIRQKRKLSSSLSQRPLAKRRLEKPEFRLISICTWDIAEPTRLVFAYAGIEYDDINLEYYKFYAPDLNPSDFPVLDYNGKIIKGNDAIARMLAKMYGMAGKGFFEQAQVDSIVATVNKLWEKTMPYIQYVVGFTVIDKDKIFNEVFKPAVIQHCSDLENLASASSDNGFLFDSGITYADFCVSHLIQIFNFIHPELMSKFPELLFLNQRVLALPELQFYVSKRTTNQDSIFNLIKNEFYCNDQKSLTDNSAKQ